MKKIKEFIIGQIYKNDPLFHASIKMKESIEEMNKMCNIEDAFLLSDPGRKMFSVIATIYNNKNITLNKVKPLNFFLYEYYDRMVGEFLSVNLNINKSLISLNNQKVAGTDDKLSVLLFSMPSATIKTNFKKTDEGYKLLDYKFYSQKKKGLALQEINNIIQQFEKTKEFYSYCEKLLKNIDTDIEVMVEKHKEHKELLTVLFICSPKEAREKIFTEMEKIELPIVAEDIDKIMALLDSHVETTLFPIYYVDNNYNQKIRNDFENKENGFEHMFALINKNELENVLIEKSSSINKKRNKI